MSESLLERQRRFEGLVLPHLDHLLAFAARRTSGLVDAEDALQDACTRAWMAFDDLRDERATRAWLYRILRSVLSDAADRTTRRGQLLPLTRLEDVHERLVSGEPDAVFDAVAQQVEVDEVRDALAVMPDDFGTVVELHDIEGFTYQEIADMIGIPLGTVMSRMSRGRRLLAALVVERRTQVRAPAGPSIPSRGVSPS